MTTTTKTRSLRNLRRRPSLPPSLSRVFFFIAVPICAGVNNSLLLLNDVVVGATFVFTAIAFSHSARFSCAISNSAIPAFIVSSVASVSSFVASTFDTFSSFTEIGFAEKPPKFHGLAPAAGRSSLEIEDCSQNCTQKFIVGSFLGAGG